MTVTNACPQYNPCNTCKGDENPCRPGKNHIDLCDKSFEAIAHSHLQPKEGIKIQVEKTDLPEGPCGGNNGFVDNAVLYDSPAQQAYWDSLTSMTFAEYPSPGGSMMNEVCRRVPID